MRTLHEIAQRWQVRAEDFPDETLDTELCFAVEFMGSGRQLPLECNEPILPLSPVALDVPHVYCPEHNRLLGAAF